MKKILIFSTAYLPMLGGAEIAVKEITNRLPGREFDLICSKIRKDLPDKESIGRVNVWRVGKGCGKWDKFLFPWLGFRLAQKLYVQNKYDLVWAIMASFGGLAALIFKGQFSGVPYVLTLQEGDSLEYIKSRARWLGPIYGRIFQKADRVTAISSYLKEYAKSQRVPEEKISVIPNGVDFEKFYPVEFSKKEELKKKLGINKDEKIVITVSRLVKKNGIGDLIGAMDKMKFAAKLLVLGSGPLEKELKARSEELKLQDRILFLGDVPNERVPEYLSIADVFCRPSLSEGLGNSFLEAMAAGIPIVGTNAGGIPDFLEDRETGLFCLRNDSDDIRQKIEAILEDEGLKLKLIQNARNAVSEKYDWKIISKQMESVFESLTN